LSKTKELVPAARAISILSGLPKDSSGREAGSYLLGVETSLSVFSFHRISRGSKDATNREGRWFEWDPFTKEEKFSGSSIIGMGSLTGSQARAPRYPRLRGCSKRGRGKSLKGNFQGIYFDKVGFDDLAKDFLTDYRINGKDTLNKAEMSVKYLKRAFGRIRATEITTASIKT
jgi:hypothetical protein